MTYEYGIPSFVWKLPNVDIINLHMIPNTYIEITSLTRLLDEFIQNKTKNLDIMI